MLVLTSCTDYGIVPIIKIIRNIFMILQIIGPTLAIVSIMKICLEAVIASDMKMIIEQRNKIRNSVIALLITFFLPIIVNLTMSITLMQNTFQVAACWDEANNIKLGGYGEYKGDDKKGGDDGVDTLIINPKEYEGKGTKDNPNGNSGGEENGNDSSGVPGESSSGKVSYLTKNGKKWSLSEKMGYSLSQGATTDGQYIYVVFKGDDSHARIGKFDIASRKLISKSEVMNLGHANDMTYDYSRKKLFVTRRENSDLSITMIDPNTFAHKAVSIKNTGSYSGAIRQFNGIAYDKGRGQLLIRARFGNSKLVWVNSNYTAVKGLTITKWFLIPTQGMEIVGNKVIYSQSLYQTSSAVISYDKNTGKKIKSTKLGVSGELEGIFYLNGTLYGVTYDKSGKYKTLIYRIKEW